jgi:hypothetical protein
MKSSALPAGLAILASALVPCSNTLFAQGDDDGPQPIVSRALAATVDYGNAAAFQPAKHDPNFDRLGLLPGQVLNITVQFPVELAGEFVMAEALDGGTLTVPEKGLFIGSDGNVAFQFQAGSSFGACRVAVHQPDDSNFIHLWVVDADHPENIPPNLPGVY